MKVDYTEHAWLRMRQRDITEDEVEEALQRPLSAHRIGTSPHKREVDGIIGIRLYTVVYTKIDDVYRIITVF